MCKRTCNFNLILPSVCHYHVRKMGNVGKENCKQLILFCIFVDHISISLLIAFYLSNSLGYLHTSNIFHTVIEFSATFLHFIQKKLVKEKKTIYHHNIDLFRKSKLLIMFLFSHKGDISCRRCTCSKAQPSRIASRIKDSACLTVLNDVGKCTCIFHFFILWE